MRKVKLAFFFSILSPVLSAAVPPVERLEGGSISEDDTGLYGPNPYLFDDNASAPASDGDSDLGEQVILRKQVDRAPVRFRADTFLFWSNNTGSAANNEEDGWFFGGSLSARWKQRLTANLYFDTYAYQDAYFYDSSGLDFQSSELGIGLIATVPAIEGLTLYGRYEFLYVHADNPLLGALSPKEHLDSRYHRLRVGAFKALYSKPNHVVTLSTNARWDFSSSGAQRRQQFSGRLSYTWSATDRLRITSYYRLSYRDYISSNRHDWNQYVGIEANYTVNEWVQLYGSILYGVNDSNTAGRDYEALQGGLGLGLRASF